MVSVVRVRPSIRRSIPWLQGRRAGLGMAPGLASAGNIAASEIIAQGEIDHDQEPDQAGSYENPRERFFVADMHKKKDDEDHFGEGNTKGGDVVERAEI